MVASGIGVSFLGDRRKMEKQFSHSSALFQIALISALLLGSVECFRRVYKQFAGGLLLIQILKRALLISLDIPG